MSKEKVVILNSGGIDSKALAKMMSLDENIELYSVFISMPGLPSNDRQLVASKETADKFCVSHDVVTINADFVGMFFDTEKQEFLRSVDLSEEEMQRFEKNRLMPAPFWRNIVYSMGMAYARSINASTLIAGQDHPGMNKWCHDYSTLTNNSTPFSDRGDTTKVTLKAPLEGLGADQIAAMLTVEEYKSSYSCTRAEPCTHCHACKRRERFEMTHPEYV
jgi:7-cyano-7-deazaguanine synthase in queuosine biosynthesis